MSMWRRKEVEVSAPIQMRSCARVRRGRRRRRRRRRRSACMERLFRRIVEGRGLTRVYLKKRELKERAECSVQIVEAITKWCVLRIYLECVSRRMRGKRSMRRKVPSLCDYQRMRLLHLWSFPHKSRCLAQQQGEDANFHSKSYKYSDHSVRRLHVTSSKF